MSAPDIPVTLRRRGKVLYREHERLCPGDGTSALSTAVEGLWNDPEYRACGFAGGALSDSVDRIIARHARAAPEAAREVRRELLQLVAVHQEPFLAVLGITLHRGDGSHAMAGVDAIADPSPTGTISKGAQGLVATSAPVRGVELSTATRQLLQVGEEMAKLNLILERSERSLNEPRKDPTGPAMAPAKCHQNDGTIPLKHDSSQGRPSTEPPPGSPNDGKEASRDAPRKADKGNKGLLNIIHIISLTNAIIWKGKLLFRCFNSAPDWSLRRTRGEATDRPVNRHVAAARRLHGVLLSFLMLYTTAVTLFHDTRTNANGARLPLVNLCQAMIWPPGEFGTVPGPGGQGDVVGGADQVISLLWDPGTASLFAALALTCFIIGDIWLVPLAAAIIGRRLQMGSIDERDRGAPTNHSGDGAARSTVTYRSFLFCALDFFFSYIFSTSLYIAVLCAGCLLATVKYSIAALVVTNLTNAIATLAGFDISLSC